MIEIVNSQKADAKNKFDDFFVNPTYLELKNSLFNYRLRKYYVKKEIEFILKNKDPDKIKILDVGCGISPVAPKYKKTTYTDISSEAIDVLRKQGYNSFVSDITKIPVKSGSFDIVCCSEVLEHVKSPEKALKECRRVLKKGGFMIITVPMHDKYWMKDDDWVEHLRRFEDSDFKKLLVKVGFEEIESKKIGSTFERFLTRFIAGIYFNSPKEKKKKCDQKMIKLLMPSWKLTNIILFSFAWMASKLTTRKGSSVFLYTTKK